MTRRVLVVDDDPLIQQIVTTVLDLESFEVVVATDADEALRVLAADRPDLVVSDVMMPGTDGFELCRAIRADDHLAYLPVILLTGRDEMNDKARADEVGADAYFTKPFSPLALIDTIESLLDERRR